MNNIYEKAMIVSYKLNKNEALKSLTKNWCGTQECRVFTQIIINAIDFKNEEKSIDDLMFAIIEGINNIEIGDYDEYAKGFIAGEMLGMPNEKNKKLYEKIEKEWAENMDIGYYPEAIKKVLENE